MAEIPAPNYQNPELNRLISTPSNGPQQIQQWQNITREQHALGVQRLQATSQIFGSIAALPNPTQDDVVRASTALRQIGVPGDRIAAGLAEVSSFGNDPAKIKQWAYGHVTRNMTVEQQLHAGFGTPTQTNVGDQIVPQVVRGGSQPGVYPAGGNPLPLAMSPESKAAPIQSVDPRTGQGVVQPRSNVVDRYGYGRPAAAPAQPASAAPAPTRSAPGQAAPEPQAPSVSSAPRAQAPAMPPGGVVTSLSPGEIESAKVTGAGSGTLLVADRADATKYRDQVYPLEQAIPALERLGPKGTGPGTETVNNIKSFLLSAGVPGVDANKIKDYDEAKKYLTDFVNRNGNSGTNDKLAAAFAGNPSVNISNAAAVDVAKSALALKRMQAAKVAAFDKARQQEGLPEAEYGSWASKWSRNQDPRAFGYDMMSRDAQKKLVESMPADSAERNRFLQSLREAHSADLMKRGR